MEVAIVSENERYPVTTAFKTRSFLDLYACHRHNNETIVYKIKVPVTQEGRKEQE